LKIPHRPRGQNLVVIVGGERSIVERSLQIGRIGEDPGGEVLIEIRRSGEDVAQVGRSDHTSGTDVSSQIFRPFKGAGEADESRWIEERSVCCENGEIFTATEGVFHAGSFDISPLVHAQNFISVCRVVDVDSREEAGDFDLVVACCGVGMRDGSQGIAVVRLDCAAVSSVDIEGVLFSVVERDSDGFAIGSGFPGRDEGERVRRREIILE